MPSAGKHTTGAKRGNICNKCQVLENTNVSFDWLIVQKFFNKHIMNSNSKHFFWRWLEMFPDKFLPHWNMLTWWLSPSNNSLGLLFRPYKTNVAVSKSSPQKCNLGELIFWGFCRFKGNLASRMQASEADHPGLYSAIISSEKCFATGAC